MTTNDLEQELMALIAEAVPPARRPRIARSATLREVGLDSLTLMIVVSQFLERHPMPTATLERLLPNIRTVGDLLDAGRAALDNAPSTASHV